MTKTGMIALFKFLRDAYGPRFSMPTDKAELAAKMATWVALLEPLTDQQTLAAAVVYGRQPREWPPTPGELRSIATPRCLPAEQAWLEVTAAAACCCCGEQRPSLSTPAVERATDTVGWGRICASVPDSEADNWNRLHFIEAYDHLCRWGEHEQQRAQIAGAGLALLPKLKTMDDGPTELPAVKS